MSENDKSESYRFLLFFCLFAERNGRLGKHLIEWNETFAIIGKQSDIAEDMFRETAYFWLHITNRRYHWWFGIGDRGSFKGTAGRMDNGVEPISYCRLWGAGKLYGLTMLYFSYYWRRHRGERET